MPYAKLRNNLLAVRARRHHLLEAAYDGHSGTVLQLSLNIPGADKTPSGVESLFCWGDAQLRRSFPDLSPVHSDTDLLGPWALYTTSVPPAESKYRCCTVEESQCFARLLDIDVYASAGQPCDRHALGIAQRSCMLCPAPAKECIRAGRHAFTEMKERLEVLLKPFVA